ncbi:YrpD family protein [Saccharibacillus sacchari]|uniref:YrpD family protein n=1 Tax=Saccharibacillus sacchari TaxID=456493 RepID=UPI0004BC8771|nr:YrpD family protein [Saccharibacillus sacchari]
MKKVITATVSSFFLLSSLTSFAGSPNDVTKIESNVEVINESDRSFTKTVINELIANAETQIEALENEKPSENGIDSTSKSLAKNEIYQYVYLSSNETEPSYEYTQPVEEKPQLRILDLKPQDDNNLSINALPTDQTDFITDGVGGRVFIKPNGNTNSNLSMYLKVPADNEVAPKIAAYNYTGFNASNNDTQVDIGLMQVKGRGQYQSETAWQAFATVRVNGKVLSNKLIKLLDGYDKTYNLNGFNSNQTVNTRTYYNYAGTGKARLQVSGTAICGDFECKNPVDTGLTTILETSKIGVTSITNWKLVSTVVSNDNTGKNKGIFSNIKLDNTLVPSSYFGTPSQDHAYVTRDGSNTVTIDVDSNKYPF